jgi:hypothetical protein
VHFEKEILTSFGAVPENTRASGAGVAEAPKSTQAARLHGTTENTAYHRNWPSASAPKRQQRVSRFDDAQNCMFLQFFDFYHPVVFCTRLLCASQNWLASAACTI